MTDTVLSPSSEPADRTPPPGRRRSGRHHHRLRPAGLPGRRARRADRATTWASPRPGWAWPCRSTSASARSPRCRPAALVERFGPAVVARVGILLSAGSHAGHGRAGPVVPRAGRCCSRSAPPPTRWASSPATRRWPGTCPPDRQGLSFGVKQAAIPLSTLLAGAAVPTVAADRRLALGVRGRGRRRAGRAAGRTPRAAGPARPSRGHARGGATGALVVVGVAGDARGRRSQRAGHLPGRLVGRTGGSAPGLAGLTLTLGGAVCVAARIGVGWLADRRDGGHVALIAGDAASSAPSGWYCSPWPARCRSSSGWCSASGWAGPGPA